MDFPTFKIYSSDYYKDDEVLMKLNSADMIDEEIVSYKQNIYY